MKWLLIVATYALDGEWQERVHAEFPGPRECVEFAQELGPIGGRRENEFMMCFPKGLEELKEPEDETIPRLLQENKLIVEK